MLTTIGENGGLKSCLMAAQEQESDGDVWFFTYSDPPKNTWVSVAGTATVTTGLALIEKFWNVPQKAWFPQELDTPHIALLKITAESAEYWDSPSAKVVQLFGVA